MIASKDDEYKLPYHNNNNKIVKVVSSDAVLFKRTISDSSSWFRQNGAYFKIRLLNVRKGREFGVQCSVECFFL